VPDQKPLSVSRYDPSSKLRKKNILCDTKCPIHLNTLHRKLDNHVATPVSHSTIVELMEQNRRSRQGTSLESTLSRIPTHPDTTL
jgi:hypothetical protein